MLLVDLLVPVLAGNVFTLLGCLYRFLGKFLNIHENTSLSSIQEVIRFGPEIFRTMSASGRLQNTLPASYRGIIIDFVSTVKR